MITDKLCTPALLYIGFTLTHIVIDLFNKMYNTALLKFILMFIFTIMLNLLCRSGLTVLSWIIVFLPFILLTVISAWLLIALNLSRDSGYLKYNIKNDEGVNGEETVANTEETVASTEETVASTEETVASTEETVASTEETVASTEETVDVVVENMFNM